jgi:hypothetical protein
MIQSNQKTSLLVPYQLPEFIRDDPNYANFVLFLQAYYEWMEEQNNTLDVTKSLLTDMDVDTTTQQFLQYFVNDFMSYFPQNILANKSKAIKIAKQLYQSKGTPASYQFLFRIIYNSEVDLFYTKDAVLKASSGKWYVPRSLKLSTTDPNFLLIKNLRLFGNSSKAIATVETVIFDGSKTEVFISDIERTFQTGEVVTVVDSNNQTVYFLNGSVVPAGTVGAVSLSSAAIVGQISQVTINKNNRGLTYVANDPVVIYGGLNPNAVNPVGATVQVGSVTSGGLSGVQVVSGGYGYTYSPANNSLGGANTYLYFTNVVGTNPVTPTAKVGTLDPNGIANVTFIPTDTIRLKQNNYIGNIATSSGANTLGANGYYTQGSYRFANNLSSNANTTLANAFTFTSFSTFPISSVIVQTTGSGLLSQPTIQAISEYNTDANTQALLSNLGILAPIQILNPGTGYSVNDKIAFIGGSGYGAYANVTSVAANGAILSVSYVSNTFNKFSLGGMGYQSVLPVVVVANVATGNVTTSNTSNVVTGNGTSFLTQFSNGALLVSNTNVIIGTVKNVVNANSMILTTNSSLNLVANSFYLGTSILSVPGILGTGATFSQTTDRVGAITSLNILTSGGDYISSPKVSLKVQDLIVSNVQINFLPAQGDTIYQGANISSATYVAYIDSILPLQNYVNTSQNIYQLRVYNYNSKPSFSSALKIDSTGSSLSLVSNYTTVHNTTFDNSITNSRFDSANGIITYGDGTALANATFLNGLVIGNGQYLDSTGQPSSFDVLQSENYNNYTYQLTVSKEIEKYRNVLLNLLHPAGLKVVGRIAMTSNNKMNFYTKDALVSGHTLGYYVGAAATASIPGGSANTPSNNIVTLNNLYGANLANVFVANSSTIVFSYGTGISTDVVKSLVIKINSTETSNTITLQDNIWTYFANVAVAAANNGNNQVINITSLTYSYNTVNGGVYSNTTYPIIDTIRVGDNVSVNGVAQTVISVGSAPFTRITLSGNLTSGANGLLSVSRGITSLYNNVQIFGPVGTQYFAELGTETGDIIITESGQTLLIG